MQAEQDILQVDVKKDFPLLVGSEIAYLDNAATMQRPDVVLEAERDFYARHNANPLRGLYRLAMDATDRYEEARETVRGFLNARSAAEIIFTRNTTEALNLLACSYAAARLRPGDEILTTIMEHHSNMLPWRMAAARTGAVLRYLECAPDGSLSDEELERKITGKTKIVAIAHVSNVLGRVNPLEKIIALAHAVGAVVVVDAAQSVPHMPVDVRRLDADFLAFSGHKLMAPMGIGVLYGKKALLDAMPPFLTGGEMISRVDINGQVYAPLPHKFEAGTVNAGGAVALAAAITYMKRLGFDFIRRRERALTEMAFEAMRRIPGVRIIGAQESALHDGILTFTVEGVHPHDIAAILDADGIAVRAGHHCAQPLMDYLGVKSTARASLAFYNTPADIQKFIESLSRVREKMGYGG